MTNNAPIEIPGNPDEDPVKKILHEIIHGKPFEFEKWNGEPVIIGFNQVVANEALISQNDGQLAPWNEELSRVFSGDEFDDRSPEEIYDLYKNERLKVMIGKNDAGKIEILSVLGSVEAFGKDEINEILVQLGYLQKSRSKILNKKNLPPTKLREIVMAYTPKAHLGKGYNMMLLNEFSKKTDSHYLITVTPPMLINALKVGKTVLSFAKTPLVSGLLGFGQTKGGGVKHVPLGKIGWLSESARKDYINSAHHNSTRKLFAPEKVKRALIPDKNNPAPISINNPIDLVPLDYPVVLVSFDWKHWKEYEQTQNKYLEEYRKATEGLSRNEKKQIRNALIEDLRRLYKTIPISSKITEIEFFLQQLIFESPRFRIRLKEEGIKPKSINDDDVKKLMTNEFINVMSEISHKRLNTSTGKPIEP